MKESKVIEKIKKLFKYLFINPEINKIHVSPLHNRGFPDLLIVTEYGVFFIEVKRPGGKLTTLQKVKLTSLAESGKDSIFVYWVTCDPQNTNKLLFYSPEGDLRCEVNADRHFYGRKHQA